MRLYTKDHAWVMPEGDRVRVGISDFAQSELGDIAYVELPPLHKRLERGEVACTVDSLKSSSEIYAPVGGTIEEVNEVLATEENAAIVNKDPLGEGWLFVLSMSDPRDMELLLSEEQYEKYIRGS
jgi:glycine cleavage system H protein